MSLPVPTATPHGDVCRCEASAVRAAVVVGVSAARTRGLLHRAVCVSVVLLLHRIAATTSPSRSYLLHVASSSRSRDVGAAGGGDAADAVTAEVSVLRDIAAGRDAAFHFRVVSVLGRGCFGSVFKVWRAAMTCSRVRRRAVPRGVCRCDVFTRDTRTRTSSTR